MGDQVFGRSGYGFDYEGMRGLVIGSDAPRASEHKCTVRWEDGGEDYVESKFLRIIVPELPRTLLLDRDGGHVPHLESYGKR